MDPGTALGAVSLLFQVFSGCIAAYELASEARGLEKDHGFIRVRFKTEQHRLLDWARVAGIAESDGIFLANKPNRAVAMDVLDQQYQTIMNFKSLDDRFRPFTRDVLFQEEAVDNIAEELRPDAYGDLGTATGGASNSTQFPQSNYLLKTALELVEKTRKLPKRFRWVISDRAKLEALLLRLHTLNGFLRDMLDMHRGEMLRIQQIRTDYQIITLNVKMNQLLEIIKAGSAPLQPQARNHGGPPWADALPHEAQADRLEPHQNSDDHMHHLVKLAQFKAVACAVQSHDLDGSLRSQIGIDGVSSSHPSKLMVDPSALDLDVPETMLSAQETAPRRVTGWYVPMLFNQKRRRIWVEWKTAPRDPWNPANGPQPSVLRRFESLVSLLRENEVTAQFRAPRCLGYYLQRTTMMEIRYGLVFEIPPTGHADSGPVSLRDLIADKGRRTPSLSSRVRLMKTMVECVEKLHAVDWLHKGLRSDNIIFCHGGYGDEDGVVDLSQPYLTGFDYSRSAASVSMSEGPAPNLADDLYRHPNVQGLSTDGAAGRGYRKRHDLYGLGLILTEISYWKPLESVLGVSRLEDLKAKDVLNVREVLLSQSHIQSLESRVGDTVAQVCQACLGGLTNSGQPEKGGDNLTTEEQQLQVKFYEAIVRPLSALLI